MIKPTDKKQGLTVALMIASTHLYLAGAQVLDLNNNQVFTNNSKRCAKELVREFERIDNLMYKKLDDGKVDYDNLQDEMSGNYHFLMEVFKKIPTLSPEKIIELCEVMEIEMEVQL